MGVTLSIIIICLTIFSIFWYKKEPIPVVIQAGHEGRVVGNTGSSYGLISETKWNVYVANQAARQLKLWGIKVLRVSADTKLIKAKVAVAIHFDGSSKHCDSGASIGYKNKKSKEFAIRWKHLYSKHFPFKWHKDNFTKNLSNYYGYYYIRAEKFLVLELGEITCKKQTKWLRPRLKKIANLIAYAIARELGYAPTKPMLR